MRGQKQEMKINNNNAFYNILKMCYGKNRAGKETGTVGGKAVASLNEIVQGGLTEKVGKDIPGKGKTEQACW